MSRAIVVALVLAPSLSFAQTLPGEQQSAVTLVGGIAPPCQPPDLKRFVQLQDEFLALERTRPNVGGPAALFFLGGSSLVGSIALGIVFSLAPLAIIGAAVGIAFIAFGIIATSALDAQLQELALAKQAIKNELLVARLPLPEVVRY